MVILFLEVDIVGYLGGKNSPTRSGPTWEKHTDEIFSALASSVGSR